jgi:hypothetical protein
MKSVKEEALRAIGSLPDNTTIDDIMYRLYIIDKANRGDHLVTEAGTVTTEDFIKEIESW